MKHRLHVGAFGQINPQLIHREQACLVGYTKKERTPYLVPIPMTTPVVTNRPPTLVVENELATSPSPSSPMPKRPVFCAPRALMILAFTRASTAMHAVHNDPTKESVLADERLCATRAA